MGLPERCAQVLHQPIGQIDGVGLAGLGGGPHGVFVEGDLGHHAGHGGDAERQRVRGFEHRLFIFLHILAVGQRQALEDDKQTVQCADHPAGFGPDQFRRVRVALLRQHGAAGRKGIRQTDKAERSIGPDDDFFRESGEMNRQNGRHGQIFQGEIPVRDTIQGIGHGAIKTERCRRHLPVDGKRRAGQGAGAQGALIGARPAIPDPASVPAQHLHIGQ